MADYRNSDYEELDEFSEEYASYESYDEDDFGSGRHILYNGENAHRSGASDSHYTKRDPSRRRAREQAMARRRAALSSQKSQARRGSTSSGSAGMLAFLWPAVSGSSKKRAAAQKRRLMTCAVSIVLSLTVLTTLALNAAYRSKTMFSDSPLDDQAIQERLITEEANRDKVTYFLIVGVDKSSKLTDCVWVMCFDNEAHQMNVMQIPRDTYVGRDSLYPHKINAVYSNPQTVDWCEKCGRAVTEDEIVNGKHTVCGRKTEKKTESNINALIRCVNTRLSLPIDHYVLFDFSAFQQVIDAMGGVDIYLEEETKVYPNKHEYETLPAGENHLDGRMALNFMRNRQIYLDGDLGRVKAQRRIIHAMMEKTEKMSALQMLGILRAAYGQFSTDMSLEEIRSFIAPFRKCTPESLNMFTMPGNDHWVKPNPSYYVCDEAQTVEEINAYLMPYGDKLTEDDIHFPILYD